MFFKKKNVDTILFITCNRVGDSILTMGVLNWLVNTHPKAQFTRHSAP
jgi:hypothetical protein